MKFFLHTLTRPILWGLLLGLTLPALSGCFGIAVVGATTGVFAITDRRSLGTQTEDSAIEFKAGSYISQSVKDVSHFNLTSYNRRVLLTGEVPNESIKAQLGNEAARIENVLGVMNELVVASNSSLTARANDSLITSKVKARFIDANEFSLHHVKVVTEASTVFLLGIVSSKEAAAAIQIARKTSGVGKVVSRMMVESNAEIERIDKSLANSAKTN